MCNCAVCVLARAERYLNECIRPYTVSWDEVPEEYKQMCINSKPEDEWVVILPTGERLEDMD